MGDNRASQMQQTIQAEVGKGSDPLSSTNSQPDGLRSPSISGSTPDHEFDNEIELPDHDDGHDIDGPDDGLDDDQDQKELQPTQPPKRKGGRKPVCSGSRSSCGLILIESNRYMPLQRSVNKETDRLKLRFGKEGQNT